MWLLVGTRAVWFNSPTVFSAPTMPSYKDMVTTALRTIDDRTGSSYIAIRNFCNEHYGAEQDIVEWRLKAAIKKLQEERVIKTHHRHTRSFVMVPNRRSAKKPSIRRRKATGAAGAASSGPAKAKTKAKAGAHGGLESISESTPEAEAADAEGDALLDGPATPGPVGVEVDAAAA